MYRALAMMSQDTHLLLNLEYLTVSMDLSATPGRTETVAGFIDYAAMLVKSDEINYWQHFRPIDTVEPDEFPKSLFVVESKTVTASLLQHIP